jgi:hypothetical protein
MSSINKPNSHVARSHQEGIQMASMKAEGNFDTEMSQALGQNIASDKFAIFGGNKGDGHHGFGRDAPLLKP